MIDMLDWRKKRDDWFGEVTRQSRLQAVMEPLTLSSSLSQSLTYQHIVLALDSYTLNRAQLLTSCLLSNRRAQDHLTVINDSTHRQFSSRHILNQTNMLYVIIEGCITLVKQSAVVKTIMSSLDTNQ